MNRIICAAIAFLVGSSLLASCTPDRAPAPVAPQTIITAEYEPPGQVRSSTFVWSAEPDVDLFDERGRLIRAAQESKIIAYYAGIDVTYPGFAEALDPHYAIGISTTLQTSLAGTIRAHILEINDIHEGFKATICSQESNLATRVRDEDYRIKVFSGREEFVEFGPTTEAHRHEKWMQRHEPPRPAPETQYLSALPTSEHRWSAPTEDLFTGTGLTVTFGSDLGETMHRCEEWGRSIEPDVPDRGSELIISPTPPETLPAYPGW
ncbi:hypothetical protein [Rhodococcus sp. DMU2021]|uniref:hypothetical protein n=1 Tax=Rhodococcus sp. DMU2021 TaxID=2866997 RepID=UPI002176CC46|nr:hypothetical protein [Rhodococcus sp. DMU2021]